ncbi:MAG TPA: hypothetical protein VNL16_07375 [Chloroflexota bacterium]|nr:hypothetical protein [Chloroflexota bacterium]
MLIAVVIAVVVAVYVAIVVTMRAQSTNPAGAASCTLTLGPDDDMFVTFDGLGATDMCNSWQGLDGNWSLVSASAISASNEDCSGSYNGLSWQVFGGGGIELSFSNPCPALNQWAHGGTLTVP